MVRASGAALVILVVPLSEPNAGSAAVLVDELDRMAFHASWGRPGGIAVVSRKYAGFTRHP